MEMDCIIFCWAVPIKVENGKAHPPTPCLLGKKKKKKNLSLAAAPCIRCRSQPTRYETNEVTYRNRIGNNFVKLGKLIKVVLTTLNRRKPLFPLLHSTHTRNVTSINIFNLPSGPFECCVAGNGAHVYGHTPISSIQNKSIQNSRGLRLQLAALALRIKLPVQGLPQRFWNSQWPERCNLFSWGQL